MVDLIIIFVYLLIMLGVSIYYGVYTKTMSDYSVANKGYSTPILVASIVGIIMGAYSMLGAVGQVMTLGLSGLILYFARIFELLLTAQFIAPGLAKFKDAISPGDVMAHFYGKHSRILTGLGAAANCIAWASVQILGIDLLLQYFLEVNPTLAKMIACSVIVIYSALGGIRTVTLTDIIQLSVLAISMPMLCSLGLEQFGGFQVFVSQIPATHLSLFPDSVNNLEYVAIMLLQALPIAHPAALQRYLVARDEKQLKSALRLSALTCFGIYLMTGCLGLLAFAMKPELDSNLALPYLINTILPLGLKGFVAAAMIAVLVSVGDSLLHVVAISFVRDIVKPLIKKPLSDKTELRVAQMSTLVFGFCAISITLSSLSLNQLLVVSHFLWIPMVVFPLLAGLLGFSVSKRSFVLGATFGFLTAVIWFFFIQKHLGFNGIFVSFAVNGLVFSINHAFENRHVLKLPQWITFSSIRSSLLRHWHKTLIFVRQLKDYLPTPQNMLRFASTRVDSAKTPYTAFGIFAGFMCAMPYLDWQNSHKELLPCTIIFRFLGGFFSFFLLLRDRWPQKLKTYLSLYWYVVLLYTLSFLTMFMALDTNFSWRSLSEMLIGFFLLAVLVDWLSFLLIMGAGTLLAVGAYAFIGDILGVSMNTSHMDWAVYVCGLVAAIGVVFSRRKENEVQNQLDTIRHQGFYIAHEASAPLVSIAANAQGLSHHLPTLIAGYEAARRAFVPVKEIPEFQLEILRSLPEQIRNISQTYLAAVNILLAQIKGTAMHTTSNRCSVAQCIENALQTYSFLPHEHALITWEKKDDFEVPIQQEMLVHVLYNLIKNSLYQIAKDQRGEIKIWTELGDKENQVHFKDTASGISESEMALIFKPSYTTKKEGNGLGLAFSRQTIESAGGQLLCHSKKNQYAEFVLIFPTVNVSKGDTYAIF